MRYLRILSLVTICSCSGGGSGGSNSPNPDYISEYNRQYGLNNIRAADGYSYLSQNNKPLAGDGVKVAIIDTGVQINHIDIADNYDGSISYDYVNNDNDPSDDDGHGTRVASIVAGVRNGSGMHGIAYNAKIIAMKALDDQGFGSELDIASAISDAAIGGADIINLSLGSTDAPNLVRTALLNARNNDVLTVAATGNDGNLEPEYPAAYASDSQLEGYIIAVGSVQPDNLTISNFSNHCGLASQYCLVAPGENIYAANNDEKYAISSGTSFSTPHVSGAAAVIKGAWPHLSAPQLSQILLTTATDLGDAGPDSVYGQGLLNLDEALRAQGQNLLGFGSSVYSSGYDLTKTSMASDPIFGDAFSVNIASKLESAIFFDDFGRDYKANLQDKFRFLQRPHMASINLSDQNIVENIVPINLSVLGYSSLINLNIKGFKDKSINNGFGLKFITIDKSIEQKPENDNGFSFTQNLKDFNSNLDLNFGVAFNHDQLSFMRRQKYDQGGRMGDQFSNNPFRSFINKSNLDNLNNRRNFNQIFLSKNFLEQKLEITASTQSSYNSNSLANIRNKQNQILDLGLSYNRNNDNISLSAGQLTEFDNNILNSKSLGAFESSTNPKSSYLKLSLKKAVSKNSNLYFSASEGLTKISGNNYGIFRDFSNVRSRSLAIGFSHNDFAGGNIGINYVEPMRVYSGKVKYNIATSRDNIGNVFRGSGYASLKPRGKERNLELFFNKSIDNSTNISFRIMMQKDPGNIKDYPDNYVGYGSFNARF